MFVVLRSVSFDHTESDVAPSHSPDFFFLFLCIHIFAIVILSHLPF